MAEAVKFKDKVTPEQTQKAVISKRARDKERKVVEKNLSTLERLKVKYVPIKKVHPNEWNPNRQSERDFELLLRSIEEDGFTTAIVVNSDWKIVDGEHRWRAAMTLGFKKIPVVQVDMTEEQMRISTIRHNRARGSHDIELEAELLRDLQKLGAIEWAQDSLMLDDQELDKMLEEIVVPDMQESDADESDSSISGEDTESKIETCGVVETKEGVEDSAHAMTQKAVDEQRRREKLIAEAKTEQEREWARRDTRLYRVALMFSGGESAVVKEALGDTPAETLYAMCEEKLGEARVKELLESPGDSSESGGGSGMDGSGREEGEN